MKNSKLGRGIIWVSLNPIRTMIFVLSFTVFFYGIYQLSPAFILPPGQLLTTARITGVIYLVFGGAGMWGAIKNNIRFMHTTSLILALVFFFLMILAILAQGSLFPPVWIGILSYSIFAFIMRLSISTNAFLSPPDPEIIYIAGPAGPAGVAGVAGVAGAAGETGAQGTAGLQGTAGEQGTAGLQGIQGEHGTRGRTGITGTTGIQGESGIQGTTGLQGIQGESGIQGTTGLQGIQGESGDRGLTGTSGLAGVDGPTGADGIQGESGERGRRGMSGLPGEAGQTGETGLAGIQGEKGQLGEGKIVTITEARLKELEDGSGS